MFDAGRPSSFETASMVAADGVETSVSGWSAVVSAGSGGRGVAASRSAR